MSYERKFVRPRPATVTNVGRFLAAMPKPPTLTEVEQERLQERNNKFALIVVAGLLTSLLIACSAYQMGGREIILTAIKKDYSLADRMDMGSMTGEYSKR